VQRRPRLPLVRLNFSRDGALAQLRPKALDRSEMTPLQDVLTALADELERARTLGLRVEGAICAIAVRAAIDSSVIAELQQLDAVLQHIGALRDFAGEASRVCSGEFAIDVSTALERVTLADVRARLAGACDDEDAAAHWEML